MLAGLLLASAAWASDVDIRLERVSIYQLCRVIFGEVLSEPYAILDGSLLAGEEHATVDVRRISRKNARALLETVLRERGYVLEHQGGVTMVKRPAPGKESQRTLVYRPRFRSVSYLQGTIRSFVPQGRFAGGAAAAAPSSLGAPGVPPATAAGAHQTAVASIVPAQGAVLSSQDVLVFEGAIADVQKVEALIAELDLPAREVLVRAYVFEVGSNASDGSAVSLAVSLLGGKATANAPAAQLPYSVGLRVAGIEAAYSILQSDSRFKVLSSPTLRIRSGEHAKLSVGSEVPVLGSVSLTSTGQPAQSVEYRSSGVILNVTAEVLEEAIYLLVQQQVSSFVATTTGVNASPTLLKRDLMTRLGVRSGDVVVMGGLDEARAGEARSGPSGLFSFLGARSREEGRSELILLLEATLFENPAR